MEHIMIPLSTMAHNIYHIYLAEYGWIVIEKRNLRPSGMIPESLAIPVMS